MKKTNDYVDNHALLAAIKDWKAKRETKPDLPLNNTIGSAILAIAHNLSRRWNFVSYTPDWKEQMIGDGIERAVAGIKNFDPDRFNNPHAYISTICFRAFQDRIKREKKESMKKYKYFVEEVFDADCADMAAQVDMTFYHDMVNKIAEYDEQVNKTKSTSADEDEPEQVLFGLGKIYGSDF